MPRRTIALRTVVLPPVVLFCVLLWTPGVWAQSREMRWQTVNGGGGVSASGTLELKGTVGQPDAGAMMGGGYRFEGGFWVAFGERTCDVDGDGDCDASDLAWIVACYPDPATCLCPGNPDRNRDTVVDGNDTQLVLVGIF